MNDLTRYAQVFKTIKILPFQQEVLRKLENDPDGKKMVMMIGAPGCGKTYSAVYYALLSICEPDSSVLFVSTSNHVEDNAINIFHTLYNDFNFVKKPKILRDTRYSIVFENGSHLNFVSGVDLNSKARGFRSDILIIDDFHEMCENNPSGVELVLLTSSHDMVYMTTRPFDIQDGSKAANIYHDLRDNILEIYELPSSLKKPEIVDIPTPNKIRVYSKVDFDKAKSKLRAKSENENKPIRLMNEMENDVELDDDIPFAVSGTIDLGNVGFASTHAPTGFASNINSMYSGSDPFFSMLSRLPAAHAVWKS